MKSYYIVVKNENGFSKIFSDVLEIINKYEYAFIDRQYAEPYKIRIRGIKDEEELFCFKKILELNFTEDEYSINSEDIYNSFQNIFQVKLYAKLYKLIANYFKDYMFKQNLGVSLVISVVKDVCVRISEKDHEGFNSHLSHFVAFYDKLDETQQEGLIKLFENKKKNLTGSHLNEKIEIDDLLEDVSFMIEKGYIDFFAPKKYDHYINDLSNLSHLHYLTYTNKEHINYINSSRTVILNRWFLNMLYVTFTCLGISVIEKYFMNYIIASEVYDVQNILNYSKGEKKSESK